MQWDGVPYTGTRDDKAKRQTLALRVQAPRGQYDIAAEKRRAKQYADGCIAPDQDKPEPVYSGKDTVECANIPSQGKMSLLHHVTLAGHYRHMSAGLAGDGYDPTEPTREAVKGQCRKVYGYAARPNSPFKRAAAAASSVVIEKKGKGGK